MFMSSQPVFCNQKSDYLSLNKTSNFFFVNMSILYADMSVFYNVGAQEVPYSMEPSDKNIVKE